jgi:hypothetical protein
MSARRTSRGSPLVTAVGVCLVLSALLVAAILVPPLLWTLVILTTPLILPSDAVLVRKLQPMAAPRSAPPRQTAPRSPPLL